MGVAGMTVTGVAAMGDQEQPDQIGSTRATLSYPFWIDAVMFARWGLPVIAILLQPYSDGIAISIGEIPIVWIWILGTVGAFFGLPYLAFHFYKKIDPVRADIVFKNEVDGYFFGSNSGG